MRASMWWVVFLCVQAMGAGAPSIPFRFELNRGQSPADVKYLARGAGYLFAFTDSGTVMTLKGNSGLVQTRLRFVGANPHARIEAEAPQAAASNYLLGRSPQGWHTSVPAYSRLTYRQLYPGLDLTYYGNGQALEYDLMIAPGADPSLFSFEVEGASSLRVEPDGDLLISTSAGAVRQHRPVIRGGNPGAAARYHLVSARRVRFAVDGWDGRTPLVIDPVLSYASFIGGSGLDTATSVAVDSAGNIYVTGQTLSSDFPVTQGAAFNSGDLPGDVFVAKFNPAGSTLQWATFIGGRRNDMANRIAVDSSGNAYVAGFTDSPDFPTTTNAFQTRIANSGTADILGDAFLFKLNVTGTTLIYSTYLGGAAQDMATALAVDVSGFAYVGGQTVSGAFPTTTGAYRRSACSGLGWDSFVTKVNASGSTLDYSTYLCGGKHDQLWDLAIDASGNVYVTGQTTSTDFPTTTTAVKRTGGGNYSDIFVTKLNATGSQLVYSTYLGGALDDVARGIAVDASGSAYLTGWTYSPDFPTTAGAPKGADSFNALADDAFIVKLGPTGGDVVYATLLGGSQSDRAYAITLDRQNQAIVAGGTSSPDFAPATACQPSFGGVEDAFVAKLNTAGTSFVYSQTLGGVGKDHALGVVMNPAGEAVFVGETSSPNMPTSDGAYRSVYNRGYRGGADAFIARMGDGNGPAAPCISMGGVVNAASFLPASVSPGELITLFGAGIGPSTLKMLELDAAGHVTTTLAGTRVLFDGVAAPLFYVSATQVSAFVPYSVQLRLNTAVVVEYQNVRTAAVNIPVSSSQPGVLYNFSVGGGQALLWNEDGSLNSPLNPAPRGSTVFIWGTGEGETIPAGVDGGVNSIVYPVPRLKVSVTVAGQDASIAYAGAAPQVVAGVIQVNFRVPTTVPPGSLVPLTLKIGDNESQPGLVLAVK